MASPCGVTPVLLLPALTLLLALPPAAARPGDSGDERDPGADSRPERDRPGVGGLPVTEILRRLGARLEAGVAPRDLETYRRVFDFTDTDRDGRHSREEFVDNGRYMTREARSGIFRAADSDRDGFVSRREYVFNRIVTDEAKRIVQGMDTDGDGTVDRAEFLEGAAIEDAGLAGQVFHGLDTDGDGELRIPEYLRVWGQWARAGGTEDLGRRRGLLGALDRDGDGTLSREEIAAAPASLRTLDRDGDGRVTPRELGELGPPRALDDGARESPGPAGDGDVETSPRHHEWVEVKTKTGRRVRTWVVYPEVDAPATTVVVIHENHGLDDWARGVADQLAAAGYLAVAPDLLSATGPGGGGTEAFESSDAARTGIYALPGAQVAADLDAIVAYARGLKTGNGKVAVAGFCWGGGQAFRCATRMKRIAAVFVFYGRAPGDEESYRSIEVPVYGFYGGNDFRITGSVPEVAARMKELGKTFEPVTHEGAGHAFMRLGEAPDASEANRRAREEAWKRWKSLLSKL